MARPVMPIGSYTDIRAAAAKTKSGEMRYRAQTYFRDYDGRTRRVERWGDSASKAKRKLQAYLTSLIEAGQANSRAGLKDSSRFREAAEQWLSDVERSRRATTIDNYRQRLESLVLPALGELQLREISVGRLDAFMAALHRRGLSVSTLRNVRTVVTGTLGTAARHGALRTNPARDMLRIEGGSKRPVRALTAAERTDLLAKLDADKQARDRDLPDLVRFMLGTGVRIGEALAVRWCDVDLEGKDVLIDGEVIRVYSVSLDGNVVPVRGKGLVRHTGKTAAARRVVPLPEFLVTMLQVRCDADTQPHEPIFMSNAMTYRWPGTVGKWIRHARVKAGYPWLTSHVFRKTAATILDEQHLTARQIADVLGHARPSMTQDVYMHRGAVNPAAAVALDEALRVKGST